MIFRSTHSQRRSGFTLIELSIVLVIIGLIAGGVVIGRDIIHIAAIRKTISQVQEYVIAVNVFNDRYRALPGDMPNAYQFFGSICGANTTHPESGCNGDGDGSWRNGVASDWGDGRKAWRHLSLAGFIAGDWPGGSAGSTTVPGVTNPRTALGGDSMWTFVSQTQHPGEALRMGAPRPPPDTPHANGYWPAIKPADAYSIDSKLDDGIAGEGRVRGAHGGGGGSTGCLSSGDYNVTNPAIACIMFFIYF